MGNKFGEHSIRHGCIEMLHPTSVRTLAKRRRKVAAPLPRFSQRINLVSKTVLLARGQTVILEAHRVRGNFFNFSVRPCHSPFIGHEGTPEGDGLPALFHRAPEGLGIGRKCICHVSVTGPLLVTKVGRVV